MDALLKNASIDIAGATHHVRALSGREAISSLFSYEVTWRVPIPLPAPEEIVGAAATLLLDDRMGSVRAITGVFSTCTCTASQLDLGEITGVLRPTVYAMTLGRSSRTFQSMTLPALLENVLGPCVGAGGARLAFPIGNPIAYRVQRNECDWAFVERTLSDAGLIYFFDHGSGSSLVIADGLGSEGRGSTAAQCPFISGRKSGQSPKESSHLPRRGQPRRQRTPRKRSAARNQRSPWVQRRAAVDMRRTAAYKKFPG